MVPIYIYTCYKPSNKIKTCNMFLNYIFSAKAKTHNDSQGPDKEPIR